MNDKQTGPHGDRAPSGLELNRPQVPQGLPEEGETLPTGRGHPPVTSVSFRL